MIEILLFIVFLFYYVLCKTCNHLKYFNLLAVLFFCVSLLLRLYVNIKDNADFGGYSLWEFTPLEINFSLLFSEPWFYALVNFFHNITDDGLVALEIVYYINFFLSTIFFIWVASKTDIAQWKKVLFFTMFYILFTYTTLRNTPAYILVGLSFYAVQRGKKKYVGFLSFLAHTSSIPAISATVLGFRKPSAKFLALLIFFSIIASYILQLPELSHISDKYDVYSVSDSNTGSSIFHLIYFGVLLSITIFLFVKNKPYVYNNIYIFIFSLYLAMFFQSSVMGFRFSVYLIIFLCLHPYIKKPNRLDSIFNRLSLILVGYFIYTFYANHPLVI